MTSFPAAARRVGDPRLTADRRLRMLRECVLRFAPYGFRATWHHLLVSAGIPRRLEDDPESLVRAEEELREARSFWRVYEDSFAAGRSLKKAAGQRVLRKAERWLSWGANRLAYCPDPDLHPTARLISVTKLLIEAYSSDADFSEVCPLCRSPRRTQPCPGCGVELRAHLALELRDTRAPHPDRWRQIWQRTTVTQTRFRDGRLAALRLGRRLVTEVPAKGPGRRAFVDILPATTNADPRRDPGRAFKVRQWDYDEQWISTFDHDIGAELIRSAKAEDEQELVALLEAWGVSPYRFDYPWNTADPL